MYSHRLLRTRSKRQRYRSNPYVDNPSNGAPHQHPVELIDLLVALQNTQVSHSIAKIIAVAMATRTRAYCQEPLLIYCSTTAQSIHAISLSKDKNSYRSFAISLAWCEAGAYIATLSLHGVIVRWQRKPTAYICINANAITPKISSFGNPCKQVSSLDIGAMTLRWALPTSNTNLPYVIPRSNECCNVGIQRSVKNIAIWWQSKTNWAQIID